MSVQRALERAEKSLQDHWGHVDKRFATLPEPESSKIRDSESGILSRLCMLYVLFSHAPGEAVAGVSDRNMTTLVGICSTTTKAKISG